MEKTEKETVVTDNSGFERRKPSFNREVREGSEGSTSNYRPRERQSGNDRFERRSFNPNFDERNRIRGGRDGYNKDGGENRPYHRNSDGQSRSFNRNSDARPFNRGGERPERSFNRSADRPYNKESSSFSRNSDRPFNRERSDENRSFNRSNTRSFSRTGERPERSFNRNTDRPFNRENSGEGRSFGRSNDFRPFNRENGGESRSFNRSGESRPYNRDNGSRPFANSGERNERSFNRTGYNKDRSGEARAFNRDSSFGGRRDHDSSYKREGGERSYGTDSRSFDRAGNSERRPYGAGQRSFDRGNSFNRTDSRNRDFNREGSFSHGGERRGFNSGERSFGRDNRSGNSFNRGGSDYRGSFGDNKRNNWKKDNEPIPYISEELNVENELLKGDIRLNRYISMSGVCSRRDADELITSGRVTVNGEIVTELGSKVSANDVVAFDGEIIRGERNVYILMNKPKDYITTLEDPNAEKIVTDLLKGQVKERVYPVGRLDKNSLGVLILTNDGEFTKIVTHPSFNKKKIYHVTLDKPLQEADMEKIATGIELEDGFIFADEISCDEKDRREVGVEIHSGRNRIVRRMFEHVGYKVRRLDRVYFAGLTKKGLQRGEWRYLTQQEVESIKKNNN